LQVESGSSTFVAADEKQLNVPNVADASQVAARNGEEISTYDRLLRQGQR
jgi:hypothetical protein